MVFIDSHSKHNIFQNISFVLQWNQSFGNCLQGTKNNTGLGINFLPWCRFLARNKHIHMWCQPCMEGWTYSMMYKNVRQIYTCISLQTLTGPESCSHLVSTIWVGHLLHLSYTRIFWYTFIFFRYLSLRKIHKQSNI